MGNRRKRSRADSSHSLAEKISQGARALLGSMIGSAIVVVAVGPLWAFSGLDDGWSLRRVLFAWAAFGCSVTAVTWYARKG